MKPETKRTESKRQNRGVFQEDIEAAVEKAVAVLGPQGRMIPTTQGALYNAHVGNPALGTIWYGDLLSDDLNKVNSLGAQMNVVLEVHDEGFRFI